MFEKVNMADFVSNGIVQYKTIQNSTFFFFFFLLTFRIILLFRCFSFRILFKMLDQLPSSVIIDIVEYIIRTSLSSVFALCLVNKRLRDVTNDDFIWGLNSNV